MKERRAEIIRRMTERQTQRGRHSWEREKGIYIPTERERGGKRNIIEKS